MNKRKASFHWSGGKDSALALYYVLQSNLFEINDLWTSFSEGNKRVSMHGLGESLLEKQVEQIGINLKKVFLKEGIQMTDYNLLMSKNYKESKTLDVSTHIFGDIHLADLKRYRDEQLENNGLVGHYPLWQKNTKALLKEFIDLGFKAIVICVDSRKLGKEFLGREINHDFFKDLPSNVDPCGENGEFHTFVYDGPIFNKPIDFKMGKEVFKEYEISEHAENDCFKKNISKEIAGFWFCDLEEV